MTSIREEQESSDWDMNYEKLKAFKKRNGHSKVPKHYSEDMQLAVWVGEQRRQYKLYVSAKNDAEREKMYRDGVMALSAERIARLNELAFETSNKNPRHMRWDFRYNQLKEFSAKYGHTQVPIGWEDNVKLANWVSTQRQEYKNMKKGRTSQLNEHRIQLLNDLGFAWEVQRGGRRRQLAPAGSEAAKKVTSPTEKLCIVPGKALIGGKDGMPMSVTGSKSKPPPSKKFKSSAAKEETTEDEQISPQDRQQQMLQQQRFAGVVPGMPGMWQNSAAFAGMDPQHAFFGAHATNFAAGPYWPMGGMGPFPPGFFPPFPYGAAAQGGMMHNPMAQQSLEMMIANSNNQSRSNNRSDPPSGENPMMAMPGAYPFVGQFVGQQMMQQSQSGTENRNVTNNSKRSARAGDPPADPPTSGNSNGCGNKNSTSNGENGPHSANKLNQGGNHGADDSAAGTSDPLVGLGMSNEMNPNETDPLPLNHKRSREMNGRHFEDTEDDDSF